MKKSRVTFSSGRLSLEGVWHLPEGKDPLPAVVVLHPHPLYGGDMHSTVVPAICDALAKKNIIAFRFNFRGVGESEGSYDGGTGEREDVKAAITYVASSERVDARWMGLCGYSFGAGVAMSLIPEAKRIQALALISPPITMLQSTLSVNGLRTFNKPKLIMCGSDDFIARPQDIERLAEELSPPKEHEIVPGADHFWFGYEERVATRVAAFFLAALKPL